MTAPQTDLEKAAQPMGAPPPAPPEGYAAHYLKSVIDQTKQQWADTQEWRNQEAEVARNVIEATKKGDFGTAAEILIPHLLRGAAGAAKGIYANATEPYKGEMLGAPITPMPGVGGALEAFAEEGAAATAAESSGIIQKIKNLLKGDKAGQPQAEEAMREGVKAGGKEAGISTVQPQSLRTVVEEPIQTLDSSAKSLYRQIDQAAGTDFKALNEKLDNTEYQIRQLTETEEDVAKEAQLEKSRTAIMDKIEAAKQQARGAGVDPKILDRADAQFRQARALSDLETKVFKNPNIIQGNAAFKTPETVNVKSAVKTLQKLQDTTKYGGSRLEQALGKEGAKQLLERMYAAERAGMEALSHQEVAKWIAGIIGAGGAATAYEALKPR
jgi:hypothetical protein